jgi:hypothetical protein
MTAHAQLSYIKSGIRIFGYLFMLGVTQHPCILVAAILLLIAEVVGIVEEIGE